MRGRSPFGFSARNDGRQATPFGTVAKPRQPAVIGLVGVDGTGSELFFPDAAAYRRAFAYSHVRTLCKTWPSDNGQFSANGSYSRGPTTLGFETLPLARTAADQIRSAFERGEMQAVMIAGYSRGGAAAVEASCMLAKVGIEVESLVLFDAVDRALGVGNGLLNTLIPTNVRHVVHARRDPRARSRETFGNCGTRVCDPSRTSYTERMFFGTHGALGGCPWPPGERGPQVVIDEGALDGETAITPGRDIVASGEVSVWVRGEVWRLHDECKKRLGGSPSRVEQGKLGFPSYGVG